MLFPFVGYHTAGEYDALRPQSYTENSLEANTVLEPYTMSGIRCNLQIYKDAQRDVLEILRGDQHAGGQIAAFLQELRDDQDLLDSLNIEGYEDDRISVRMLVKLQRQRWNAWRLTLRDIYPPQAKLPYRILYAFDGRRRIYHILAVMHRDKDYDDDTLDRVCSACKSLGIDPLPRS